MSLLLAILGIGLKLNLEKTFKGGTVPSFNAALKTDMSTATSEWIFLA